MAKNKKSSVEEELEQVVDVMIDSIEEEQVEKVSEENTIVEEPIVETEVIETKTEDIHQEPIVEVKEEEVNVTDMPKKRKYSTIFSHEWNGMIVD